MECWSTQGKLDSFLWNLENVAEAMFDYFICRLYTGYWTCYGDTIRAHKDYICRDEHLWSLQASHVLAKDIINRVEQIQTRDNQNFSKGYCALGQRTPAHPAAPPVPMKF